MPSDQKPFQMCVTKKSRIAGTSTHTKRCFGKKMQITHFFPPRILDLLTFAHTTTIQQPSALGMNIIATSGVVVVVGSRESASQPMWVCDCSGKSVQQTHSSTSCCCMHAAKSALSTKANARKS